MSSATDSSSSISASRSGASELDLAEPDPAVRDVEERVAATLERAVDDVLHRLEHGDVDLLRRAREDVRAEVALVGVDADPPYALLLRGLQRAEPAAAGRGEHDVRPLRDLVERDLLALRLVDEVLRVARRATSNSGSVAFAPAS